MGAEKKHAHFMKISNARAGLLQIPNDQRTQPNVIKQLLLLDYSLETQQSVVIQGMGSEACLPVLCDQIQMLMIGILGHMPLHGELRAVLADWMQLPMQVSKVMGHCFLDCWAFASAEAVEVLLEPKKSDGHPSGAALHAGLKGDGPLLLGLLGLCAC